MEKGSGSLQHYTEHGSLEHAAEELEEALDALEKEEKPRVDDMETWNLKKEILFLTLFTSNTFVFMTYSLMGPLFPEVAKHKGVGYTLQGIIFGVYALTQIIASPLIGKVMPHIGYRCTFITGILCTSVFNVTFGFLPQIEDRSLFIVSCFACRIGMALGVTAMNNAIFVIVAITWPKDLAFR